MKKFWILMLLLAAPAYAYVYGGTNFGFGGYPDPTCYLGYSPNQYSVNTYVDCVNLYVKNGNNDIKRIAEAQQDALDEANRELGR